MARHFEHSERPQPSVADPPSELGDLWELLALGRVSTASRTHTDIRCLHFFFFLCVEGDISLTEPY